MRTPVEHVAKNGDKTYKVQYRIGGRYSSQTFRRYTDAEFFAGLLGRGDANVQDALAWLAAKDEQRDGFTFAEWHDHYVGQLTGITERTRADYKALRRRYLGELDGLSLPLITRGHVSALVNRLDRPTPDRDALSPKTIRNVVHMLSSCMALALDEGHITRNPCRRVRLPAARHDAQEERFLTYDEFRAVVEQIPAHYQPLVVFLVGTGLRWSEATALQSRHVNIAAGTVRVQQAWKRIPGGFEIGPPKTPRARRTVNAAVMALAAVRPLLGKPNAFVFTTPNGLTISHSNFYNRIWKPAVERSGVEPPPRLHDLRHTHASWLISDGKSLESVQDQLGHESILTTRAVYGGLLPALGVAVGKSASEALERALPGGLAALSPADTVAALEQ